MTSSVTAPLERQFGQMPGLNQMTSASSAGASVITLQFGLDLSLDIAEQEVQAAINASGNLLAGRSAGAADLRQGQSRRCADPHACGHVEDLGAHRPRGFERDPARAEDLATDRRRPRQHQRRTAAGGAHSGQSAVARRLWPQHRRYPHHDRQSQRQYAEGQFRRPDAGLDDQRQRSAHQRRSIPQPDRRLPQRRTGAAYRRRHDRQRPGEHQARRLGQYDAGDHPQRPAPARRQHHSGRRSHPEPAAADDRRASRRRRRRRAERSHRDDPRFGRRRGIRARPRGRPGRAGDLRVPAHAAGHHHSEPVGAAVAGRHVRRDVSARLQPRQSVADGADHRHRLRRRRRHRHDREHRPLRRRRHGPARGGAARLRADRLHHHFADDLADRGADPAVVHGRRRRPPVPRILHHACGHDRHLRRRLADAGADDVRQADPSSPGGRAHRFRPQGRAGFQRGHRPLRPRAELGAGPPAD